jgi:hypothetical protein
MAENNVETNATHTDALEDAIREQLSNMYTKGLLTGAQAVCTVILTKINEATNKPKVTLRDYKRLTEYIVQFCSTGVSRQINDDGTTSELEDNANESNDSKS